MKRENKTKCKEKKIQKHRGDRNFKLRIEENCDSKVHENLMYEKNN